MGGAYYRRVILAKRIFGVVGIFMCKIRVKLLMVLVNSPILALHRIYGLNASKVEL